MSFTERGPRQRRPIDDNRDRERTVRWPPSCRPAPELQREMDAALAEAGVSTTPVADSGFQRNRAKAFEVVRKIRSRSLDRPPGRRPI
jgi:hypothetical protein